MQKRIKSMATCLVVLGVGLSVIHCRPDTPPKSPTAETPASLSLRASWLEDLPARYPLVISVDVTPLMQHGEALLPMLGPCKAVAPCVASMLGLEVDGQEEEGQEREPLPEVEGIDLQRPVVLGMGGVVDAALMDAIRDGAFLDLEEGDFVHARMVVPATDSDRLLTSLKAWGKAAGMARLDAPLEVWGRDGVLFTAVTRPDRVVLTFTQSTLDTESALAWLTSDAKGQEAQPARAVAGSPLWGNFVASEAPLALYGHLSLSPNMLTKIELIEVASAYSQASTHSLSKLLGRAHGMMLERARQTHRNRAAHDALMEVTLTPTLEATITRTLLPDAASAHQSARDHAGPVFKAKGTPQFQARCPGDLRRRFGTGADPAPFEQRGDLLGLHRQLNDPVANVLAHARVSEWSPKALPTSLSWTVVSADIGEPVAGLALFYPEEESAIELNIKKLARVWSVGPGAVTKTTRPMDSGTLVLLSVGQPPESLFDLDQPVAQSPDLFLKGSIPMESLGSFKKPAPMLAETVSHGAGARDVTRWRAGEHPDSLGWRVEPGQGQGEGQTSAPSPGERCLDDAALTIKEQVQAWSDPYKASTPPLSPTLLDDIQTRLQCAHEDPATAARAAQVLASVHLFLARLALSQDDAAEARQHADAACKMGRQTACRLLPRLTPPALKTPLTLAQLPWHQALYRPRARLRVTVAPEGTFLDGRRVLDPKATAQQLRRALAPHIRPLPPGQRRYGSVELHADAQITMARVEPILQALLNAQWRVNAVFRDLKGAERVLVLDPAPAKQQSWDSPCHTMVFQADEVAWRGPLDQGLLKVTSAEQASVALLGKLQELAAKDARQMRVRFDPATSWQQVMMWFAVFEGYETPATQGWESWRTQAQAAEAGGDFQVYLGDTCPPPASTDEGLR